MTLTDHSGQPAGSALEFGALTTALAPSRLRLGPLADLQVTVATMPYMSVLLGLLDGVGNLRRGLAPELRDDLQAAAGESGQRAFRPFSGHDRCTTVPNFLMPVAPQGAMGVGVVLEALRDLSPRTIADQVSECFAHDVPEPWRYAVDRPRHWHQDLLDATRSASTAVREVWQRARPTIEQERCRLDIAQDRGQLATLLNDLTPKMRYRAETLIFEADWGHGDILLGGRPLVLVPIIAGPAMIFTNVADAEPTVWIGYPVTDFDLTNAKGLSTESPLQTLLGLQRSLVLRYLHRASGMAEIASLLRTTPANATFHCQQLEAADLVARRRVGRNVLVERTPLGSALMELLDRRRSPSVVA